MGAAKATRESKVKTFSSAVLSEQQVGECRTNIMGTTNIQVHVFILAVLAADSLFQQASGATTTKTPPSSRNSR